MSQGPDATPYSTRSFALLNAARAALQGETAWAVEVIENLSPTAQADFETQRLAAILTPRVELEPPLTIGLQPGPLSTAAPGVAPDTGEGRPWQKVTTAKKALIRKSVELPRFGSPFEVRFDCGKDFVIRMSRARSPQSGEIAAAEHAVKANPEDVDRLRTLAGLYFNDGQDAKAEAASAKAVELYRGMMVRNPKDGRLPVFCAECLPWKTEKQLNEAEELCRRAVALAPEDWRNWVSFADLLRNRARVLRQRIEDLSAPSKAETAQKDNDERPSMLRAAEKYESEKSDCLEKAIAWAPSEPKVYLARARSELLEKCTLVGDRIDTTWFRGTDPDLVADKACKDVWKAVELSPNDVKLLCYAIWLEIQTHLPIELPPFGTGRLEGLPAKSAAVVEKAVDRLRIIVDEGGSDLAGASAFLALVFELQSRKSEAYRYLAHANNLEPESEVFFDLYVALLLHEKSYAEALPVGRNQLKHKDCAHVRAALAKILNANGDPVEAERIVAVALEREPEDRMCNLMAAALILRKSDLKELSRAGQLLDRAAKGLNAESSDHDVVNHAVLRIAYLALTGEEKKAQDVLRSLKPEERDDERVAALVKILEEPDPTPAK